MDVAAQRARAEDENEADHDQQHLRGEVHDGQEDVDARRLLDADDVERDEQDDHDRAADDVPGVVAQGLPEDRQVMRDEERRDSDRRDVSQNLSPGSLEADELVEPVPREARGPARLGIADRALGVGGGRRREDEAGDDEDDRRQAEREDRGDAERVIDRRTDVAVGGGEERGRSENALQGLAPPPSGSRHRRTLDAASERSAELFQPSS